MQLVERTIRHLVTDVIQLSSRCVAGLEFPTCLKSPIADRKMFLPTSPGLLLSFKRSAIREITVSIGRPGSVHLTRETAGVKVEFSRMEVLIFPRDDRRTAQMRQVNFFPQAFSISLACCLGWRDESFFSLTCLVICFLSVFRLR
jgi:hypothetical protein